MSAGARPLLAGFFALLSTASAEAASSPPPVRIDERVEYYRIEGQDHRELYEQMRALGPVHASSGRRGVGDTRWTVTWTQRGAMVDGQCRLADLEVVAEIRVMLPQWSGERGNRPLVREWRRYLASLEEHEEGHRRHGREAASAIRDAIWALPPQPDCATLERAVNRVARQQLRRYAALTRRYDAQTDFGATQGVHLQP